MSCSIRISVIDSSRPISISVSFTRSARDRPAAGSSSISSRGRATSAIPTSSWRCSPCERSITRSLEPLDEADLRGHRARPLAQLVVLARRHEPQVAAGDAERRQVQVVLDGEPAEQPRRLERPREPHASPLARLQERHVAPEELDATLRRRELPRDQVEQRRLPGPVGAEHGPALAGPHVEVHAAHGVDAPEPAVDSPQAKDRFRGFGRWLRGRPPGRPTSRSSRSRPCPPRAAPRRPCSPGWCGRAPACPWRRSR